jgi:hypothetical protein
VLVCIRAISLAVLLLAPGMAHAVPSGNSLTILINGFASAVPFVGYGFQNLKEKIPGAQLYSYIGAVEGWTYIAPKVLNDVRTAYRNNPDIEINLIGVSFGANLLTRIVAKLDKDGIPVSYLGIIDGLPLTPITPNVRRVDNFTCSVVGCLRDNTELTKGNVITISNAFDYKTSHIELPNNHEVQRRILHQISTFPLNFAADPECASVGQPDELCTTIGDH